jgi:hypothetical protein
VSLEHTSKNKMILAVKRQRVGHGVAIQRERTDAAPGDGVGEVRRGFAEQLNAAPAGVAGPGSCEHPQLERRAQRHRGREGDELVDGVVVREALLALALHKEVGLRARRKEGVVLVGPQAKAHQAVVAVVGALARHGAAHVDDEAEAGFLADLGRIDRVQRQHVHPAAGGHRHGIGAGVLARQRVRVQAGLPHHAFAPGVGVHRDRAFGVGGRLADDGVGRRGHLGVAGEAAWLPAVFVTHRAALAQATAGGDHGARGCEVLAAQFNGAHLGRPGQQQRGKWQEAVRVHSRAPDLPL